jgi:hypothetical protein
MASPCTERRSLDQPDALERDPSETEEKTCPSPFSPSRQRFRKSLGEKMARMKRLSSLGVVPFSPRLNRWADFRRFQRSEMDGRFAGLKIRGRHHIVRLHNWSPGGACVSLPNPARIGERVRLVSGSLRCAGRICWIANGRAGVEFVG